MANATQKSIAPLASFTILSDLHLEAPAARPTYSEFEFDNRSPYLVLLGDIGLVNDARLISFLENQLSRFEIIFYILGNHEPYDSTLALAKAAMREFESQVAIQRANDSRIGQFVLLDQVRYDITPSLTVLGSTLYSAIRSDQTTSIQMFVSDFERIECWTMASHNAAHEADLAWLNQQVSAITKNEPQRKVAIFTHYSPTVQPEANSPRHLKDDSGVQSAFMTDLSGDLCWTSPAVTLWAFGHTHFNCDFVDPGTGKRIVANQKGYKRSEAEGFDPEKIVTVTMPQSVERPATTSGSRLGKVRRLLKSMRPP